MDSLLISVGIATVLLRGRLGKMGSVPKSSMANMRTPHPAQSFRRALSLVV